MPERIWTILEALNWTQQRLERQGEQGPRQTAQQLLCHATGLSRLELYTNFDLPLDAAQRTLLREALTRRLAGEPLQYILGSAAFYHIELAVTPAVLIPRPETEGLVELVVQYVAGQSATAATLAGACTHLLDIGTGSGAIALALAHELPKACFVATDCSASALAVAQKNTEALGFTERIELRLDDLATALTANSAYHGSFDVVVSNPPYIPRAEIATLPAEVREHEPLSALDGGEDGLELYARLVEQAQVLLKPGGLLAVELHEQRVAEAAGLLEGSCFVEVATHKDLAGRPRYVTARTKQAEGDAKGDAARTKGDGPFVRNGQKVRPPLSEQRPPLSEQRPPLSEQRPPLSEQRPPLSEQRPPLSEQRLPLPALSEQAPLAPALLQQVAQALRAGELLVFPTDTVYGIGLLVTEEADPQRLFLAKNRPATKELPVLIASLDDLERYGTNLHSYTKKLASAHWPGALTLVVKASAALPQQFVASDGTVALRVPACAATLALIKAAGAPLATSSANISGEPPALSADAITPQLRAAVALVVDTGPLAGGVPSTVVSCVGETPHVLRQGEVVI